MTVACPHASHGLITNRKRRPLALGAALVFVAGYALFCHGCHGDEDNELLSAVRLHQEDLHRATRFLSDSVRP